MDLGESKARPEENWRRVMFVWKRDGGDLIVDRAMGVITAMKDELKRRGISVYDNDFGDDDEDKYRCNLAIVFVSEYFFIDRSKRHRWLGVGKRAIIIVDDEEQKFLSFVRNSVGHPREEHLVDDGCWDPGYLQLHDISFMDASAWLCSHMYFSPPKYRAIVPGISPPDIQDFVTKYADDVEAALKPMGLDLANIDRTLRSDVLDIYDYLLLQRKKISLDGSVLLAVFTACLCCCFDITVISRMIALHRTSATPFKFVTSVTLSMKDECPGDIENGPLTLQSALLRKMYRSFPPGGDYLNYHLKRKKNTTKTFVRIDHFDVSNPYAQQQLANIACLFGAKSLVIVTTHDASATSLLEARMNFVSRVRGTNCSNNPSIMSKCYAIFISQLINPNQKGHMLDDSCNKKMEVMVTRGTGKKLNT